MFLMGHDYGRRIALGEGMELIGLLILAGLAWAAWRGIVLMTLAADAKRQDRITAVPQTHTDRTGGLVRLRQHLATRREEDETERVAQQEAEAEQARVNAAWSVMRARVAEAVAMVNAELAPNGLRLEQDPYAVPDDIGAEYCLAEGSRIQVKVDWGLDGNCLVIVRLLPILGAEALATVTLDEADATTAAIADSVAALVSQALSQLDY